MDINSHIFYIDYVNAIIAVTTFLVLTGAVILSLALVAGLKTRVSVPRELSMKWAALLALTAFFVLGYLFYIIILVLSTGVPQELVIGGVFFGGACYVYLVIMLVKTTVHRLRMAEKETRESRDLLQRAIDAIDDPFLMIRAGDYRILMANRAVLQMTDGRKPVAAGMTCGQVMHCPSNDGEGGELPCPAAKAAASKDPVEITYRRLDKAGDEVFISIHATPVIDGNGEVTEIIEIHRDVTGRKLAEKALTEHTRKMEEANLFTVLFTDILSHDLKNPISVINGCERTLTAGEEDPGKKKLLAMQRRNILRLEGMIENASKYSRLQGMKELETSPLDLGRLLDHAVANLKIAWESRGVTIDHPAGGEFPATVSPMMEDVFVNLLSNAIKYGPEKSRVAVDISDRTDSWLICVRDSGSGISDEDKDTIFKRLERLSARQVKGQGLGLAIVKRIVELHGGRVWVEDNPGGGSAFCIEIPKERNGAQGESV